MLTTIFFDQKTQFSAFKKALMMLLALVLSTNLSNAALSATTANTIKGNPPTATVSGNVTVLWPDGTTVLTNGMTLWYTHVPNAFSVSSLSINNLTFSINDIDGDSPDTVIFGTPELNWSSASGTPLTSSQLMNWIGSAYNGQQIKLSVTIPYTPKTQFGDPSNGVTKMVNVGNYTLNVPPIVPVAAIHSQGHTFAGNIGYPNTGFQGAAYQVQADAGGLANNINYYWESNDPNFAHVDSIGNVWLDSTHHLAHWYVDIYAVPKGAGPLYRQSFKIYRWFAHLGGPATWDQSNAHCQSQGYRLPRFSEISNGPLITNAPGSRAVGPLWSEWGALVTWNNNWWWTVDINLSQTALRGGNVGYYVRLTDGAYFDGSSYIGISSGLPNGYVACVLDL